MLPCFVFGIDAVKPLPTTGWSRSCHDPFGSVLGTPNAKQIVDLTSSPRGPIVWAILLRLHHRRETSSAPVWLAHSYVCGSPQNINRPVRKIDILPAVRWCGIRLNFVDLVLIHHSFSGMLALSLEHCAKYGLIVEAISVASVLEPCQCTDRWNLFATTSSLAQP